MLQFSLTIYKPSQQKDCEGYYEVYCEGIVDFTWWLVVNINGGLVGWDGVRFNGGGW